MSQTNGRTDRHRTTAQVALCTASRGKNFVAFLFYSFFRLYGLLSEIKIIDISMSLTRLAEVKSSLCSTTFIHATVYYMYTSCAVSIIQ